MNGHRPHNPLRAWIYDLAVARMTAAWYRAVLSHLPEGCRLLDVGIGTGAALLANTPLLLDRRVDVTGIDIDAVYLARCRRAVARRGLAERIRVRCEPLEGHRGGPYDAVYFSGSFMVLRDPAAALRYACTLLAPAGRLYFTQTFEHGRAPLLERAKPLLRVLTTIDFGRVTYESAFRETLAAASVEIETVERLAGGRRRSARLVVARQALGPAPEPASVR